MHRLGFPRRDATAERAQEPSADCDVNSYINPYPLTTPLRARGPGGAEQIQRALDARALVGRATRVQIPTAGRPAELWSATSASAPTA